MTDARKKAWKWKVIDNKGKMGEVSGRNPLDIPEILENILEYLPPKDVKSCRLVNKFWRDCGIAPMKKKQNCIVRAGPSSVDAHKTIDVDDLAEFSEYLNTVAEENANFPCSNFSLNLLMIRNESGKKTRNEDELVVADFLQKISPLATEVSLTMYLRKTLFKPAFPRRVDFPKLKSLEVSTVGHQCQASKNSSRKLYQFVTDILENAPSLKKVNLEDDQHSVDTIIKAKSSFTELRIFAITDDSMEKLSTWNREVKLKSLHLIFIHFEVNGTSLFQFLRSQKDSLETLVLHFSCSYALISPRIVSFPEMPKLKKLTIHYTDNAEITFPVISYQRHFPALKSLHLNRRNLQSYRNISLCQQFINENMQPVETLEELTLPGNYHSALHSLTTAQNAVRIFQNVKKLEMVADSAMLPTIFEHSINLEQLTLYPAGNAFECIDYLLMGHTRSGYDRIQEKIKREGDDFDWNQLEPGNATQSILNLQKLRVLRFIIGGTSQELEVTRASLHLILCGMGSLKCIDFGNRFYPMETKIDKAWWAELNEDCVVLWNQLERNN